MLEMLILVPRITNRLQYTFDFVFGTMLGVTFQFTTDTNRFRDYEGQKMSYGDTPLWDEPFQKSVKLLFEHDLYAQDLKPIDFLDAKAFFPVYSHRSMMPFDVLAAVFFLISRYEEYLPQIRDQYGRFTPESSCLCQLGLLDKPLVDIWVQELAKRLGLDPFPASRHYRFQPTYDVDAAWAYLHKGSCVRWVPMSVISWPATRRRSVGATGCCSSTNGILSTVSTSSCSCRRSSI